MKKIILTLSKAMFECTLAVVLLGLAGLMTGCDRNEKTEVVYHYSSADLDSTTQAKLDHYRSAACQEGNVGNGAMFERAMDAFRDKTYIEYAGAVPACEIHCDTAFLYSSDGYRTLVMEKDKAYTRNIIYVHGGAWIYQIDPLHISFVEDFLPLANAKAYFPLYPLLPNANCEPTMKMLLELYQKLLKEGKPILLMGDSAGGNIILGFILYLKSLGIELPACVLPLSPALDLSGASYPEMMKYEKRDLTLHPDIFRSSVCPLWAGDRDLTDPVVSPIYGDVKDFPPTFMFIGSEELLYPDVVKFAELLAGQGVKTEVFVGRGLWHVAPVDDIPIKQQYYTLASKFIDAVVK